MRLALLAIAALLLGACDLASGLHAGDIRNNGHDTIVVNFANTSEKTGDVLFWVETGPDGAIRTCESLVNMQPGTITDLHIPCDTIRRFEYYHLRWMWAEYDTGMAAIATRIPVSW